MAHQHKHSGLTLIELLIVISLVVTLAGLATARFVRSYASRSADHFVKELAAYLRYVQFKAVEEGAVHKLAVDRETGVLASLVQEEKGKGFREITTPFSKRFAQARLFSISFEQ